MAVALLPLQMSPGRIQWAISAIVIVQTAVLYTVYRVYRQRAGDGGRSFQMFRAMYAIAAILMTVGPIAAVLALGRLEPYPTPLGPVRPVAVSGAGTDAWVGGFVLFLVSFVSLWIGQRTDGG